MLFVRLRGVGNAVEGIYLVLGFVCRVLGISVLVAGWRVTI